MRAPKRTEAEHAADVVRALEEAGHDVYQEVELYQQGPRADIVAVVGHEVWIIETKTSMSLALIEQAFERRRFAHRVYVSVPRVTRSAICKELGIGVLELRLRERYVDTRWTSCWQPEVIVESRRWNTRPVKLRELLRPGHKTHARAGAQTGGHWTAFRSTCEQIGDIARRAPGTPLKTAIAAIDHHYRSPAGARSSLARWIVDGKVPGVELRDGKVWPVTTEAA